MRNKATKLKSNRQMAENSNKKMSIKNREINKFISYNKITPTTITEKHINKD